PSPTPLPPNPPPPAPLGTNLSPPNADSRLAQVGPAVLGAPSFACADVLVKVVLIAGAGVLTMSAIRAVVGVAMLFVWLKLVPPAAFSRRATWISLGFGRAVRRQRRSRRAACRS